VRFVASVPLLYHGPVTETVIFSKNTFKIFLFFEIFYFDGSSPGETLRKSLVAHRAGIWYDIIK